MQRCVAKGLDHVQENAAATFDFAQKLVRTRDLREAFSCRPSSCSSQIANMQTQAKDLGALAQNTLRPPPERNAAARDPASCPGSACWTPGRRHRRFGSDPEIRRFGLDLRSETAGRHSHGKTAQDAIQGSGPSRSPVRDPDDQKGGPMNADNTRRRDHGTKRIMADARAEALAPSRRERRPSRTSTRRCSKACRRGHRGGQRRGRLETAPADALRPEHGRGRTRLRARRATLDRRTGGGLPSVALGDRNGRGRRRATVETSSRPSPDDHRAGLVADVPPSAALPAALSVGPDCAARARSWLSRTAPTSRR